jgi:ubiquinone biosynthesis protein
MTLSLMRRLLRINMVLTRHGLDQLIFELHLLRPFRYLLWLLPWYWAPVDRDRPRGERIRVALEELGPIFVKFGQIISTRRDLLPPDIADELVKLQDQVPPFPAAQARAAIERALGMPIEDAFGSFEAEPFASASIAQVHGATLKDGREVIVKVLRPDVERLIRRDIEVLHFIARLAKRWSDDGRRLRPTEVVEEFESTILDELDLQREAANAAQLKRNFEGSGLLYVPTVHWELTRRDVMVMERIRGVPISDRAELQRRGADLKLLAHRGVEIFFTQVFDHNFFHADMHPGNIFVDVSEPKAPRYAAVDFGIVGTLDPRDQRYLAENFLAFFERDYRRVAELHVRSGWVPEGTRVDEFESAIRTVCEPIFQKPIGEISFAQLLVRLFETARRFEMEIQPQLVLLQKTLFNIEGLGRDLYPELDLWVTAKPFLERWSERRFFGTSFGTGFGGEQGGPGAAFERLKRDLPGWREEFGETARALREVMKHLADGTLKVEQRHPSLERLARELSSQGKRDRRHRYLAALGLALAWCGTLWVMFGAGPMLTLAGATMVAVGMALLIVGAIRA